MLAAEVVGIVEAGLGTDLRKWDEIVVRKERTWGKIGLVET